MHGKLNISNFYFLVPCGFFPVRSDNAVGTRDKMLVVYKKMTRDIFKSNVAKWNLIGGIQFVRWPTTVAAKQKVTAPQTLLTAKQN